MRIIPFLVLATMFLHPSRAGTVRIIVGSSLSETQDRNRSITPVSERYFDRLASEHIRRVFPTSADAYLINLVDSGDAQKAASQVQKLTEASDRIR